MTICVAAIGGNGLIFGAADRMKSGGDIEFEPRKPPDSAEPTPWIGGSKIFQITSSVTLMTAGESALQADILYEIYEVVQDRIRKSPDDWWRVRDIANLYVASYDRIKAQRAASAVLSPLSLDTTSFLQGQATMNADFMKRVTRDMQNFKDADCADDYSRRRSNRFSHLCRKQPQ